MFKKEEQPAQHFVAVVIWSVSVGNVQGYQGMALYCQCGTGHVAVVGLQQLFTHCTAEAVRGRHLHGYVHAMACSRSKAAL
jgi:hypothetical protein